MVERTLYALYLTFILFFGAACASPREEKLFLPDLSHLPPPEKEIGIDANFFANILGPKAAAPALLNIARYWLGYTTEQETLPYLKTTPNIALYSRDGKEIFHFSTTEQACLSFIHGAGSGRRELLISNLPSPEMVQLARQQQVAFNLQPFMRFPIAFFVNAGHPVKNLTKEQLKGIYTGRITNWSQLSSLARPITALQRPSVSVSQQALKSSLLQGSAFMEAAPYNIKQEQSDMLISIAQDRSLTRIGFSDLLILNRSASLKKRLAVLSIDGVAPTHSHAQAGLYPVTADLFMISRRNDASPQTKAFLAWMQSPVAKELINMQEQE